VGAGAPVRLRRQHGLIHDIGVGAGDRVGDGRKRKLTDADVVDLDGRSEPHLPVLPAVGTATELQCRIGRTVIKDWRFGRRRDGFDGDTGRADVPEEVLDGLHVGIGGDRVHEVGTVRGESDVEFEVGPEAMKPDEGILEFGDGEPVRVRRYSERSRVAGVGGVFRVEQSTGSGRGIVSKCTATLGILTTFSQICFWISS